MSVNSKLDTENKVNPSDSQYQVCDVERSIVSVKTMNSQALVGNYLKLCFFVVDFIDFYTYAKTVRSTRDLPLIDKINISW